MRRLLVLTVGLWLAGATALEAQIVCADANFDATGAIVTTETPPSSGLFVATVTIPTNIAPGELLALGISERDGGGSGAPTAIDGSTSGSWNLVSTLISSSSGTGGYSALHFLVSAGTGSDTITVTWSASKTVRFAAGRCTVTGNAPELDVFDATPATGSSVSPASGSENPTATGIALGFIALSGDQDITAVAADETDVTNEAQAVHFVSQATSSGVAVSIGAITIDGSRDWAAHIAVFKQASAAGGNAGKLLLIMGGGQ